MKRNNFVVFLFFVFSMLLFAQCQNQQLEFDDKLDLSGGWNYEIYFTKAEEFANTLLENAKDNYGPKETPMLLSMLEIKTRQKLSPKDADLGHNDNKADEMRSANGANLSHDFATLRGFYHLSNITGNNKYRDAANAYLKYFLNNCVSPTTGLFAYGKHMYYNVVEDTVVHYRHELGKQIPLLAEMWKLEPEVMHRYTEAIRKYHIYDDAHFFYDRQANYYTGEFEELADRGTWIKHAGLFANIFLANFAQKEKRKYINWARKISVLFSDFSNPQTMLVRDNLLDKEASTCRQNPILAWYLLNTTRFFEDDFIILTALNFIRSFTEYAYNPDDQTFYAELSLADGKPASDERQSIWHGRGLALITARACILAYTKTRDKFFLDRALKYVSYIRNSSPSRTTSPGNIGNAIQFFIDMYQTNKSSVFLNEARKLAQYAIKTYFENGLIKSRPDGVVYSAQTGPGVLFSALVKLYEIEASLDFHWKAPKVINSGVPEIPFEIKMKTPTAVSMDYAFGTDSVQTLTLSKSKKKSISFKIPVDDPEFDGIFYFYFYNPDKSVMSESGEILIDDDLKGPEIQDVEFQKINSTAVDAVIRAEITDPKGVKHVKLKYELGDVTESISPDSVRGSEYVFRISPQKTTGIDSIGFFIEAVDNDNVPAKSTSPKYFFRWKTVKAHLPEQNADNMFLPSSLKAKLGETQANSSGIFFS